MIKDLQRRVAKLEALRQLDVMIELTYPDGEKGKLLGDADHFFRCVGMLDDPHTFAATHVAGTVNMTEYSLAALRCTTEIEGESAQLFWLLKALIHGPATEYAAPQPEEPCYGI